MDEITNVGKGMFVLIDCDYNLNHSWMSFASWYSISKNLPDAKVAVSCLRGINRLELFKWTYNARVPFFQRHHNTDPVDYIVARNLFEESNINKNDIMVIRAETMAVRNYDKKNLGPCSVKANEPATFISYSEGCGSFLPGKWIDRKETPFMNALKNFCIDDLTVNEQKVLELWEKGNSVYCML